MANKLRKFNEQNRAILIHKINNLIFEAEMDLYKSQQQFARQQHNIYYENTYSSSTTSSLLCTPQCSPIPTQPSSSSHEISEQLSTCNPQEPPSHQYSTLQNFIQNFNV